MFRRITRKRGIAALSIIAVLALAGGAYAFFTSTGSGTGSAAVGTASPWTVQPAAATGGPLLPGSGTETIGYTVKNVSNGHQGLTGTNATVASVNNDVTSNGTEVVGCLASWFNVTNNAPAAIDLASQGTTTGSVTVTMSNASTSQDACQGKSPDITISAS